MTADRPAVTGPVPAPESTHTPGPVFRDRGVIIHTLIAENERLKNARDGWMATLEEWEARAENADARIAELELACQRLRDDTQGAHTERDQAKAETERVWGDFKALAEQVADAHRRDAAVRALADEWDAAVDARGGTTLAPVRFLARDLRAALAGAPAVTPTETQAEGGAFPEMTPEQAAEGLRLNREMVERRRAERCPAPVADPTTGETR